MIFGKVAAPLPIRCVKMVDQCEREGVLLPPPVIWTTTIHKMFGEACRLWWLRVTTWFVRKKPFGRLGRRPCLDEVTRLIYNLIDKPSYFTNRGEIVTDMSPDFNFSSKVKRIHRLRLPHMSTCLTPASLFWTYHNATIPRLSMCLHTLMCPVEIVAAREEVTVVSPRELGLVQEVMPSPGQLEKGAPASLAAAANPTPDS